MHTKITSAAQIIWYATMAGELVVGYVAWKRRSFGLAAYLSIELALSLTLYAVAHLGSAQVYYQAYCIGQIVDFLAQAGLVVSIFTACRKTGIPGLVHGAIFQFMLFSFVAVAIMTLRFPLQNIPYLEWRWIYAIDHTVNYWLCLMLAAAPFYARLIDAANDTRQLLIYVGFSIYVVVHSGATDFAISTHLLKASAVVHLPDFAYFISLVLWLLSCCFNSVTHQWDSAQTEYLKVALRERSEQFQRFISQRKGTIP